MIAAGSFGHDATLFEVPSAPSASDVIADLCKHVSCFALVDETLSIAAAQRLRDRGVRDVLPLSLDADRIADIIDHFLDSQRIPDASPAPAMGRLIAVTKARGGIGATTVAVNLARQLARGRKVRRGAVPTKVALVDFDIQFGDAGAFLDMEDNGALRALIEAGGAPSADLLEGLLQDDGAGPGVLCAPAEIVPLDSLNAHLVQDLLTALRHVNDITVVDMPPGLVDWVAPVLETADLTLVATDTSVPSIRHTRRLISFFEAEALPGSILPVVCRESRPMIKPRSIREAEAVLERPLDHWLPDAGKAAREAVDRGQPLADSASSSRFCRALDRLAAAIAVATSAQTVTEQGK